MAEWNVKRGEQLAADREKRKEQRKLTYVVACDTNSAFAADSVRPLTGYKLTFARSAGPRGGTYVRLVPCAEN